MFKFMKSKKGFTLVELMIVVVIMAILVAVAVPIFSAVTANAKKKTCIGNQRQIISSVGDWIMLQDNSSTIEGSFVVTGGQDNGTFNNFSGVSAASITALFKTVPVCPDEANKIVVTIEKGQNGSQSTVSTVCQTTAGVATDHDVPND